MFIVGCSLFYSAVFVFEICFMLLLVVIFFSNHNMQLYPDSKVVYAGPAFMYIFKEVN
ncbi:hypothetical protein J6W20_01800 [bacterium]|nr:hypothetical protein [bacterium]